MAPVRSIRKTFHLGILVFCLVVGILADIRQLVTAAPSILLFMGLVVYGSWILHLVFCRIFRVDTDTAIITSVAAIFSPPFVPVVASSLKRQGNHPVGADRGNRRICRGQLPGYFACLFPESGGQLIHDAVTGTDMGNSIRKAAEKKRGGI